MPKTLNKSIEKTKLEFTGERSDKCDWSKANGWLHKLVPQKHTKITRESVQLDKCLPGILGLIFSATIIMMMIIITAQTTTTS